MERPEGNCEIKQFCDKNLICGEPQKRESVDDKKVKINQRIEVEDVLHTDLHMHTSFCDGKNMPEEMVLAAIQKGFSCIGFSGHSFVEFDPGAGMNAEAMQAYLREIVRLKREYAGTIRIFCGIELDYHSLPDPETESDAYKHAMQRYKRDFDYIIGSVHYIPLHFPLNVQRNEQKAAGIRTGRTKAGSAAESAGYAAVDDTPEILMAAVRDYYAGDYYKAAQAYFSLAADVVDRTGCDIIGHFDLFSKFNQKCHLFNEQDPRYVHAWKKAADQLSAAGKVFEINTGGMFRGWRNIPYPSPEICRYISQKGGRFILSGDSHSTDAIGYGFSAVKHLCTVIAT